eukprot:scaffold6410_cov107-Isochrysis_galbana.AAC.4
MGEKRASVPVSSVWEALAAELLCAFDFFFRCCARISSGLPAALDMLGLEMELKGAMEDLSACAAAHGCLTAHALGRD